MLENVSENLVSEPPRTVLEEELSGFLVAHTPGDRLEVGLSADRERRKAREENLRRGLRRAHRLEAVARAGCVVAGLFATGLLVNQLRVWLWPESMPEEISYVIAWITGLGAFGLLTVGGLLGVTAAGLRWRLLKGAARDAVASPKEISPIFQASSTAGGHERVQVIRTNQVQQDLVWAHTDERFLGNLCLWAGYAAVASWILALIAFPLELLASGGGVLVWMLVSLSWIAIGFVLALVSPVCAYHGSLRKRWLRAAAKEGLEVRDPAGCPWE